MARLGVQKVTVDDEIGRIIHDDILCYYCDNYVLLGEEATCLAEEYLKYAEAIKNFEVRSDDVWIASYPKSGTTWTQEMVWMIMNDLDYKGAETLLYERVPFFEACTIMDSEKFHQAVDARDQVVFNNSIEYVRTKGSPRFIKTHLPFHLLPNQILNGAKLPKIIYVMRNPKDVAVSYCHHGNLLQGWRVSLEKFCRVFLADKAMYGSYWKHVFGYWQKRSSPNILIIRYEDMKADIRAVIRQVSSFLGKKLAEQAIEQLAGHLSFESMKANPAINGVKFVSFLKTCNLAPKEGEFLRSGAVGKYKEELSPEMIRAFDEWAEKHVAETDFEKKYLL